MAGTTTTATCASSIAQRVPSSRQASHSAVAPVCCLCPVKALAACVVRAQNGPGTGDRLFLPARPSLAVSCGAFAVSLARSPPVMAIVDGGRGGDGRCRCSRGRLTSTTVTLEHMHHIFGTKRRKSVSTRELDSRAGAMFAGAIASRLL